MSDSLHSPPIRRNLILVGFMGTGKSAIGQRVASSLNFEFVDTDQLVEAAAGKKINQIFADSGEEAFRKLETEALRSVSTKQNQVISTGGGIVTIEENREILKTAGHVIWLTAMPDTIYQRVRHNRDRPLLRVSDPLATIETMIAERNPLYELSANERINTSELTIDETAHGVVESAIYALGAARQA